MLFGGNRRLVDLTVKLAARNKVLDEYCPDSVHTEWVNIDQPSRRLWTSVHSPLIDSGRGREPEWMDDQG